MMSQQPGPAQEPDLASYKVNRNQKSIANLQSFHVQAQPSMTFLASGQSFGSRMQKCQHTQQNMISQISSKQCLNNQTEKRSRGVLSRQSLDTRVLSQTTERLSK
mmetsp:Transcript_15267/g.25823  ORF Transcript_15267/g.25823 Transcript_15267/m.25823 type:complete len:105 (+) Transcript_15267:217-531(+)